MKGKQIIDKILEQYKHEDINFDMYIVADAQTKTVRESDPRISHADESEFFSRMEFAEIASALFNVFGFARVFYSEISFIEYVIHNKIQPKDCIVYNFSRDGVNPGKKSLIPAFCDLYGIKYTGSNAFVISLLRNKRIYGDILSKNGIPVPITYEFLPDRTTQADILDVFSGLDILMKNIDESKMHEIWKAEQLQKEIRAKEKELEEWLRSLDGMDRLVDDYVGDKIPLWEKIMDRQGAVCCAWEKTAFEEGLKVGIRLMTEVYGM